MTISFDDLLASRWMAGTDLPPQGIDLVMRSFTQEQVGDQLEDKVALHFHGSYKPLLLNRTNLRILQSLHGTTENCINKTICVYNDPTISYGGRLTGGIRLRMPTPVHTQAPPPPNAHPQFTTQTPKDLASDLPW
jgi:hypothetical protein